MSTAAPPADPETVAPPGGATGAAPAAASVVAAATGPAAHCDNCGALVTQKYCGACGQRLEPPVHSLWHFTQAALEDVTHADSRLWRTLAALMLKPGFLTREFFAGRRARYLPPVRLYLVLSALFFLWASVSPSQQKLLQISVSDHGAPSAAMTPLQGAKDSKALCAPGESREQCAQRVCHNAEYQGPWRDLVVTRGHQLCVRTVLDGGKSEREAILHSVPRAMFLFLPLLAGAMMLMYWWPRHYYVEHLLLFLHNHAFVFLLLLLVGLVSALLTGLASAPPPALQKLAHGVSELVNLAVTLYIAWYAYRSMRVVYGQGRGLTLGKLLVLSFFYLVGGSLMFALTAVFSVPTT
jgi:hypothetical protein